MVSFDCRAGNFPASMSDMTRHVSSNKWKVGTYYYSVARAVMRVTQNQTQWRLVFVTCPRKQDKYFNKKILLN